MSWRTRPDSSAELVNDADLIILCLYWLDCTFGGLGRGSLVLLALASATAFRGSYSFRRFHAILSAAFGELERLPGCEWLRLLMPVMANSLLPGADLS